MVVFESTLKALIAPRRAVPIVIVTTALVLVQTAYSGDALAALVPLAMVLGFVLLAPFTFRALFVPATLSLWKGLVFVGTALLVVGAGGALLPHALGLGPTFLTDTGSLLVSVVLFLAGGWGLGRDIELEQDLAHSQLRAVRVHLDPHFLYNTLNAIAEWCREDARVAEEAILRLSAMLEGVFTGLEKRRWPLTRELEMVRDLFELQRIRDPGALSLDVASTGPTEDVEVPPLSLLTLMENALKHGPRAGHHGPISLNVRVNEHSTLVVLENPGPYSAGNGGRGLPMLRRQLELSYGAAARLELTALAERTRTTLTLPRKPPR